MCKFGVQSADVQRFFSSLWQVGRKAVQGYDNHPPASEVNQVYNFFTDSEERVNSETFQCSSPDNYNVPNSQPVQKNAADTSGWQMQPPL